MNLRTCIRVLLAVGVALAAASIVAAGENPKARPFFGTVTGSVHWEYVEGGCPTQGGYVTVSDAVGDMAHLGRTTFNERHCAGGDGLPLDGTAIFTAANGDKLWATYILGSARVVAWDPPLFAEEAAYTVTGGTGRFENASGHLNMTIYATVSEDPSWPAVFLFPGTITY